MISVLCPTYGRATLLNELVESFIRQTDADAELIVLNDNAAQTLSFEHPRIRIVNQRERFTLGKKRSVLLSLAMGSHVCFWDDDDIYLPCFLAKSKALLSCFMTGKAAKPPFVWTDAGGQFYRLTPAAYMNAMIAEKALLHELGGFDDCVFNEDYAIVKKLVLSHNLTSIAPLHDIPSVIIRTRTGHLQMTTAKNLDIPVEIHHDFERRVADGTEPVGNITLNPAWKSDYRASAAASWEHYHANSH